MEFVDLRTGYLLTGFDDFESAYTATEQLCEKGFRVAYLNEASHVREPEVRNFTRCFSEQDEKKYQNYHFILRDEAKTKAVESLKTAMEVLEQKISRKAKFIMVVTQKSKRNRSAFKEEHMVAVITGASSGIGRAAALEFARKGYDVVLAARFNAGLEEVAAACERHGGRAESTCNLH